MAMVDKLWVLDEVLAQGEATGETGRKVPPVDAVTVQPDEDEVVGDSQGQ